MSVRIPQATIEEIRRRVEIVELISDYLPLKRAGRNFKGLCPFHKEKTPSFMVSPERQAYHCFGCGVGGNAITFVMEYEGVGFVEALRSLARRAGVEIPERQQRDPAARRENDAIHEALRLAAEMFRHLLSKDARGKPARDYLAERRISPETGAAFGMGFAPPAWDMLLRETGRRGMPPEILAKAGLARRREGADGHYDYFRNRLVFPIVGLTGRVLGFGGRALGGEEPKYLNSPETPVFRKGQNLYGLRDARDAIRGERRAVVVEGYMDVVSLHQAGVRNMVAPLGTAFVSEQARLIARFAPLAVLAFDGDDAGRRAVWQAGEHLWEAGVRVRVALLPSGDDPDSFVLAHGREGWEEVLERGRDFVEFALPEKQGQDEREEALRRLVSALARIRDELRRGVYLKAVADRAGLPEETLLRSVAAEVKRIRRFADTAGTGESPEGIEKNARPRKRPVTERVEWGILRLLVRHPELQQEAARELTPDLFRVDGCRDVAARLLGACSEGRTFSLEDLERCAAAAEAPEVASVMAAVVVDSDEDQWSGDDEREAERERRRALADYLQRLRGQGTHKALSEVQEQLREAQARGDVKASIDLLRRAQELKQQTMARPDVVISGGDA